MKIVIGPASPLLGKRIAEKCGLEIADTIYKKFPDGELYVRVIGKDDGYVVVQSLNSNEDLVYLMLIFDALSDKEILAVIPYMGYARQDKAFLDGEAVSIRAVAKMIESYADAVITVNIHSNEAAEYFKKLIDLDAMKVIGEFYRGRDVIMISPDLGSLERVKRAAEYAKCEFDYLEKKRIDAETVVISPKNIDVSERVVVIVDDIISTGGTVIEAAKQLSCRSVEAACVHAVLASNALNKLYNAGISRVIATDTIEKPVSVLTVSDLISEELKRLI